MGLVLGLLGVALFAAPTRLLEEWPWEISPLLARVFGGWYLLAAATLIFSAVSVRRAHEIPIPYATVGVWSLLILLLPLLYSGTVRTGGAGLWVLLGIHAVVLAGCAFAVVRGAAVLRADAGRL